MLSEADSSVGMCELVCVRFAYKVVTGIFTSSVVSSQVLQTFTLSVDINTIDSKIMTYSFVYSVDVNINHIHSRIMPAFSYFTCNVRFFCDLSSQTLIRE
jgi:hypothetical protein